MSRLDPSGGPRWLPALVGFLLGATGFFWWQQRQDARLLKEMTQDDHNTNR